MKPFSAYVNKETETNLRGKKEKAFIYFFVSSIGLSRTPRNSELNVNFMLKDK